MTNQDPDLRQGKRVLICDDEPRTQQALKTLLLTREITCNVEPSSMISVVGEARDGCEAVQLVKAFFTGSRCDRCLHAGNGWSGSNPLNQEELAPDTGGRSDHVCRPTSGDTGCWSGHLPDERVPGRDLVRGHPNLVPKVGSLSPDGEDRAANNASRKILDAGAFRS